MNSPVNVVQVNDVSKRFVVRKDNSIKERIVNFGRGARYREDFWALRNIDIDISVGSTVGLIGPNGSGKSTLLKAIGGIIQPTSGSVQRRGRMAALLELGAGFHQDLTGRENVYLNASILGLSRKQTDTHFAEIVEFSGIENFIDTQVKFYSSGMYVRLAFAVAVHVDPDLLLVDEVLAVGDEAFQRKCLDKIRSFQDEGRTIVLVTHSLNQVTDFCSRAIVLARGSVMFDGDPVDAVSVLRSGFEAAYEADTTGHGTFKQPSGERGKITGVRVLDRTGAEQRDFSTGDDLIVEVVVESVTPLSKWAVGLHIDNPLGQLVTGATSNSLDVTFPSLNGSARVRFALPKANFGGGEYGVTVAMFGSEDQEIARATDGAFFSITQQPRSWGPLFTNVSVGIEPLD